MIAVHYAPPPAGGGGLISRLFSDFGFRSRVKVANALSGVAGLICGLYLVGLVVVSFTSVTEQQVIENFDELNSKLVDTNRFVLAFFMLPWFILLQGYSSMEMGFANGRNLVESGLALNIQVLLWVAVGILVESLVLSPRGLGIRIFMTVESLNATLGGDKGFYYLFVGLVCKALSLLCLHTSNTVHGIACQTAFRASGEMLAWIELSWFVYKLYNVLPYQTVVLVSTLLAWLACYPSMTDRTSEMFSGFMRSLFSDVRRRARIVKLLMFTGPAAFLFEAYAIVITLVIMIQVSGQPLDGPSDIFSILSYDGFRRVVVILSAFPFIFILPGQLGVEIGGVPEMYSTRLVNLGMAMAGHYQILTGVFCAMLMTGQTSLLELSFPSGKGLDESTETFGGIMIIRYLVVSSALKALSILCLKGARAFPDDRDVLHLSAELLLWQEAIGYVSVTVKLLRGLATPSNVHVFGALWTKEVMVGGSILLAALAAYRRFVARNQVSAFVGFVKRVFSEYDGETRMTHLSLYLLVSGIFFVLYGALLAFFSFLVHVFRYPQGEVVPNDLPLNIARTEINRYYLCGLTFPLHWLLCGIQLVDLGVKPESGKEVFKTGVYMAKYCAPLYLVLFLGYVINMHTDLAVLLAPHLETWKYCGGMAMYRWLYYSVPLKGLSILFVKASTKLQRFKRKFALVAEFILWLDVVGYASILIAACIPVIAFVLSFARQLVLTEED